MDNISIDRLLQIERERENTMSDKRFQKWCKEMKIGIMYTNREGINRANDMMSGWSEPTEEMEWMPEFIRRMY
jgi:hypothetical protein